MQTSFDELDEPLRTTTFMVVDLETTGGSAMADGITEIGAVKVRGGEVLGEFQTLVHPGQAITPFVSVLTGITDSMVCSAPSIEAGAAGLPRVRAAAACSSRTTRRSTSGFLKAAAVDHQLPWPAFAVVDTAVLARRVLTRDEVPNCKLATLAQFFQATTTPNHRALSDARATVDVLHGLIARLGNLGVQSLPELRAFTAQVSPEVRRKRHLADGRARPARASTSSATAAGSRSTSAPAATCARGCGSTSSPARCAPGWARWSRLAERVDPIPCAHALEAQVRELRLIAAHKPRYNRRSKYPERSVWLKLTDEAFPRLSVVRVVRDDGAHYLGPLRSQRQAEAVRDAIHDAVPLRQCSDRLSLRRVVRAACALAGIGRCAAPCEGGTTPAAVRRAGRPGGRGLDGRRAAADRAAAAPSWPGCPPSSASSRPRWCATASRRWCAPARACSGCARLSAIERAGRGPPRRRRRVGARGHPARPAGRGAASRRAACRPTP